MKSDASVTISSTVWLYRMVLGAMCGVTKDSNSKEDRKDIVTIQEIGIIWMRNVLVSFTGRNYTVFSIYRVFSLAAATCPKLPSFESGWFLPGTCNTGKTYPGESCSVYCRLGYRKSEEFPIVSCRDDLTWSVHITPDILQQFCVRGLCK